MESLRDVRRLNLTEDFLQDLRYGLRRSPGATTAIFSAVDTVLLHSAPYARSAELEAITEKGPAMAPSEISEVSARDFTDWQVQARCSQEWLHISRGNFTP